MRQGDSLSFLLFTRAIDFLCCMLRSGFESRAVQFRLKKRFESW